MAGINNLVSTYLNYNWMIIYTTYKYIRITKMNKKSTPSCIQWNPFLTIYHLSSIDLVDVGWHVVIIIILKLLFLDEEPLDQSASRQY